MIYKNIEKGKFIDRPNRFIAHIEIGGQIHVCHVKNTGRMGELLIPGCPVYVQHSDNPNRKTAYSLISFDTENGIINVDSQVPNKVFYEANPLDFDVILPEKKFEDSRFDFYVEKDGNSGFCEIKGVTLLGEDHIAYFPDAPTVRGIKHIDHLIELKNRNSLAYLVFVVKIHGVTRFSPNPKDAAFTDALKRASSAGVDIRAYGCSMTRDTISIGEKIPVII